MVKHINVINMVKRRNKGKTCMRASWKLIDFIKSKALYGESLEDVVWRLIKNKEENLK